MKKLSLGILTIILISIPLILSVICAKIPILELNGKDNQEIVLNSKYKDLGVTAKNLFGKNNFKIKVNGKINTKKVGTYKLKYIYTNGLINKEVVRTVEVVDKEKPVISLIDGETVLVCPSKEYEELGYSAVDNYDGDITDKVEIIKNKNLIKYKVKDSSGNSTVLERKIEYKDEEAPVITLNGQETLSITLGQAYSEAGYNSTDNCDGDLTDKVRISGNVDTNKAGIYNITYSVKDSSENETIVTRKVTVKDTIKPLPGTFKSSMVYLTFDDGPSNLTLKILDILKEENVKATFFVIGKSDSLNYIIKRAYDEGHTIALHSYSHNYQNIYSSSDAYFNDLYAIRNKVQNITGSESNIIRFPGGSSNSVSNFNKGIMTRLTREVTDKGFRYFDWNISSGDAGATKDSSIIYNNVIKGVNPNKTNVVLMHDASDKTYTVNALRNIIKTLKESGYTFAPIDNNTPQVTHRVNN